MRAAAAAKPLQSCLTFCNPMDCSLLGSSVHGIFQARILEWVALSFSNAWKWEVKVKSLIRVRLQRPHGLQPTRLLHPWDFLGKSTRVGCHCLLRHILLKNVKINISLQFSHSVVSDSLPLHEPQHTRPPCPSPTPRVYPNICPLSRWCHPT